MFEWVTFICCFHGCYHGRYTLNSSLNDKLQVTDGIHIAMGFSLGNSILIEAPDGLIIVDTTECLKAARQIHQAFRRISSKPVKAIIYTHHHLDHVNGAQVSIQSDHTLVLYALWSFIFGHRSVNIAADLWPCFRVSMMLSLAH